MSKFYIIDIENLLNYKFDTLFTLGNLRYPKEELTSGKVITRLIDPDRVIYEDFSDEMINFCDKADLFFSYCNKERTGAIFLQHLLRSILCNPNLHDDYAKNVLKDIKVRCDKKSLESGEFFCRMLKQILFKEFDDLSTFLKENATHVLEKFELTKCTENFIFYTSTKHFNLTKLGNFLILFELLTNEWNFIVGPRLYYYSKDRVCLSQDRLTTIEFSSSCSYLNDKGELLVDKCMKKLVETIDNNFKQLVSFDAIYNLEKVYKY